MSIITFIIPTIGRNTLINTVRSLKEQTVSNWNAIIIFDGIDINIKNDDERIIMIRCNKKRGNGINSAGNVRNYGMTYVNTKWIAFLDDDDIISKYYVEIFLKEKDEFPFFDVIIFRMNLDGRIIPELKADNFYLCDVGISFIIKKSIFEEKILFTPDGAEDFLYLDKIRKANKKIMISPYILYGVKQEIFIENQLKGSRVFINNNMILFIGYIFLSTIFS